MRNAPTQSAMNSPTKYQLAFDEKYITAQEVARVAGVSRVAVHHARQNGQLPDPIIVGDNLVCIWERKRLAPHLEQWKTQLANRKAVTA